MNITKAIAEQVATKMVKPIAERISNEHDILNDIVKDIAVRGIPEQVYDTFTKYPRFFYQTRAVYIANGSQVTMVEIKERLPCGGSCGCGLNVPCTAERAIMLINRYLNDEQDKLEEECKEKNRGFDRKIIHASIEQSTIIPISQYIPKEFSLAYATEE